MSIVSIITSLGGKRTGNSKEYVLDCWLCSGEQKLYFNVNKGIGFCQKCQTRIDLKMACKEAGLSFDASKEAMKELAVEYRNQGAEEVGLTDYLAGKFYKVKQQDVMNTLDLPEIDLPQGFFLLEESQDFPEGRAALKYLLGRGFKKSVLYNLKFGVCFDGFYGGRVIVPFWENGKLVYWQARDYTDSQELKIRNPYYTEESTGKSDVIFNYDGIRDLDICVICESWGSALAVGSWACGINGKSISDVQVRKLLKTQCKSFIVMLDHKAELDALKVAGQLADARYVSVALLPEGDPNEVPRRVVLDALSAALPFSSAVKLRAMQMTMKDSLHRKV